MVAAAAAASVVEARLKGIDMVVLVGKREMHARFLVVSDVSGIYGGQYSDSVLTSGLHFLILFSHGRRLSIEIFHKQGMSGMD